MNRYFKRLRAAFAFALFVFLSFSTPVFVSASDSQEPLIKLSVDFTPIIATAILILGLVIAIILALVFLLRHIANTKNRIYRLSNIKSEETAQLYDDLEGEKWVNDENEADKPRDVRIEDEYKHLKSSKASVVSSNTQSGQNEKSHGPIPERDMPGYDPAVYGKDPEIEPVSPYQPIQSTVPQPPLQNMQSAAPYAQPAPGVYAAPLVQPIVYRPDSEVEIVMNDDYTSDEDASSDIHDDMPVKKRVRAIKRRGKVPGLITKATPKPAYQVHSRPKAPFFADDSDSASDDRSIPRLNFRHLSITPKAYAPIQDIESSALSQLGEDVTVKLNGEEKNAAAFMPFPEAPIMDISENIKEQGDSDIDVKFAFASETEVEENSIRTLNDVLNELDSVEDDVTELETTFEPAVEEELVFIGSEAVTENTNKDDDIFTDEECEAKMFLDGKYVKVRYKTSFLSRFIQSEEKIQDYYSVIKNAFMSYNGVESSIGWSSETFTYSGEVCAKVTVLDEMLLLYLALDFEKPWDYKNRYVYSSNKSLSVPMFIKIKSDKALKYAIELIIALMRDLAAQSGDMPDIDYRRPYETVPALIERGLIKIIAIEGDENKENEDVDTEKIKEKLSEFDKSDAGDVDKGAVFDFEETDESLSDTEEAPEEAPVLEEESEEAPALEEEPEEAPALEEEPEELPALEEEPEEAPVLEEESEEAPALEEEPEELPALEEEPEVAPALEEASDVKEQNDDISEEFVYVDAQSADSLLSDEEAIASIELVDNDEFDASGGKLCEVNLDTICEAFADGETVDLKALKKKHLVSQNAGRIKILARGTMTKTLTIYADRFSLQAVKMITLAGGRAEQYK